MPKLLKTYLAAFILAGIALIAANSSSAQVIGPEPETEDEDTTATTEKVEQDTIRVDTLNFQVPGFKPVSKPYPENRPSIVYITPQQQETSVTKDTLTGQFIIKKTLYGREVSAPSVYTFEELSKANFEDSKEDNWRQIIDQADRRRTETKGLLDFKINIPGGKKSAFTTIFGKPSVNLSVTGTANLNVGASIQNTADPAVPPSQQTQIDPLFNQNLRLNIQGTIGDKLTIATDWDTEREFDFENRLNIVYEGYEDEIIKQVEIGNVSIETGNSLIRGGGALFGVKTVAELGALRLSTVLSQQDGEGQTKTITGGSQEQEFNIRPADYQNQQHFFLDFFTRQQFEQNMSNPQQLGEALSLTELNVWIFNETLDNEDISGRSVISLVDLGTNRQNGTFLPPTNQQDPFPDELLDQFRENNTGASAQSFGVELNDIHQGFYVLLQEGVDYEVNRILGYISLNTPLRDNQTVAVSYAYEQQFNDGTTQRVEVGDVDVSPNASTQRIYLKLLKPRNVVPSDKGWELTMRNIYSLGTTNLRQDNLEMDVQFTRDNVPQSNLPSRNTFLIQDLGLDRVDTEGALNPDNLIDFSTGTLDANRGRIVFPFLEPFGQKLVELINETGASQAQKDELIEDVAFTELYTNKQNDIRSRSSKNKFFEINGTVKGGVSDNYFLGIALVEGSVNVFANGTKLQEGSDFNVDYSVGSITILNDRYLSPGQEIRIEYESNQLVQIEQKSFTGVRAQYDISNNFNIGSTIFRLKEQPLQDKIRIGDEPINNTIFGLDANGDFDVPWLTRAIDKVPLLQTKEPSSISFNGEWAQFRPGVAQTNAIQDAIDDNNLFKDERNGLSFIDDFEGVETNIGFMAPARWSLAAPPAMVPGHDPDRPFFEIDGEAVSPLTSEQDRLDRADLRSQYSWYSIPLNISSILGNTPRTPESRQIFIQDVFPQREVLQQDNTLTTLDVYYDPGERGQYNYNEELKNLLENEPERTWGGMTTTLPSGLQDLNQNNVEFLEFWVQSLLPGARQPTPQDLEDYDGKIYIELGIISEDVIPNLRVNSEDGLAERPTQVTQDNIGRSFIPDITPEPDGQFSNENRDLEDVGLDGAPNVGQIEGISEPELFRDFLAEAENQYADEPEQLQEIREDPSNDDYFYFGQDELNGLPLQERFYRMFGYTDGNTPVGQGDKRAVTNQPDTEGLLTPSSVERNNSYFQYEVDWNPADVENLKTGAPGTFIVDQVGNADDSQDQRWFQVRIPLEEYVRKIGQIENFQNISYIRMWMSGYEKPFTLRFATFELVGSQWRKAEEVNDPPDELLNPAVNFRVASVNIEENASRQPIPYREPPGSIRAVNRGQQQLTLANEQSIALQITDLGPQDTRMIKRVYPGGLNFVNYSNLRMFVHGEGYDDREDMQIVVRMGTDLVNNYYEYRQPVTPTEEGGFNSGRLRNIPNDVQLEEARRVWKNDENGMNIVLSTFNQLKQLRNRAGVDQNEFVDLTDLNANIAEIMKDAPAGAIIGMKGNPSLDRISEIGLGIRNPNDPESNGVQELDGEIWMNELRVSGFDDRRASAVNLTTRFNLADFADVNTTFSHKADGFGALSSRLGERQLFELTTFDLSSTVNLHKFLPDRFGWNFPVSVSYQKSTSTPRFLPNQGDIRLEEFIQSVENDEGLTDDQQQTLINDQIEASETFNESFSLNFSNISKQYSESTLAKYTLDKTTLRFVYNTSNGRDPVFESKEQWSLDGSINYNVSFNKAKFFRPFGYLENVGFLSPLSEFRLGYTPTSINTSFGFNRRLREDKRRLIEGQDPLPLQQTHTFNYNTRFGLNYSITPNIIASYQMNSTFDLSNAGIKPFESDNPIDSTRFETIPTIQVFKDVLFDSLSSRRSDFNENYSLRWNPPLNKIKALSWLDYTANYQGRFSWNNSPRGSDLGATISNSLNIDQNIGLDISSILNNFSVYKNLKAADERETNEREAKREREDKKKDDSDRPTPSANGNSRENSTAQPDSLQMDNFGQNVVDGLTFYSRKIALAALSMRSIDFNYSFNNTSSLPGFTGSAPLRFMFNSPDDEQFSPGFKFRTGINRSFDPDVLIENTDDNTDLTFLTNQNDNDNITLNTQLNPFKNFRVDLSWDATWNKRNTESVTITPQDEVNTVFNQSGDVDASVWAFGTGYEALFQKQLQTAFDDLIFDNGGNLVSIVTDSLGNNNGRTILNRDILQSDFREAYLGSAGNFGDKGFATLPKPSWRVTWSGLEQKLDLLNNLFTRITLNHSYSGSYRVGWRFNTDAGTLSNRNLGGFNIINERPEFEANSLNIQKNFNPMVGLNLTWKSGIRTNLSYTKSEITSFSLSNTRVSETVSQGFKFNFNYSVRNFRIPLFKKLRNTVDFTVNGSFNQDIEQNFELASDIAAALQEIESRADLNASNFEPLPLPQTGQSRINVSTIIGYQFSNTVKANFEYGFRKLIPKSSRLFERTDHDIKFNIVISIRSS